MDLLGACHAIYRSIVRRVLMRIKVARASYSSKHLLGAAFFEWLLRHSEKGAWDTLSTIRFGDRRN